MPYEERVVTASRRAQSSLEAPNATTVITAEDIRLSGATTPAGAAAARAGRRGDGAGRRAAPTCRFRGFNQRIANKVLVLVDGRTEYQDFLGHHACGRPSPSALEEIERIEVIRGPGSALYGANAMLGVVNIITRAPGTGPRARASRPSAGGRQHRAAARFVEPRRLGRAALPRLGGLRTDGQVEPGLRGGPPRHRREGPAAGRWACAAPGPTWPPPTRSNSDATLGLSGGVNRSTGTVYPLGVLRNYFLDGVDGLRQGGRGAWGP